MDDVGVIIETGREGIGRSSIRMDEIFVRGI